MIVVTHMADTVGIRELKAKLSHHLERVKKGQRLTVTERGRAIATIVPIEQTPETARLWKMVEKGLATWSGGKPTGPKRRIKLRGGQLASDAVLEDRE